jgi:Golgi SNAP receptor complex protein 1
MMSTIGLYIYRESDTAPLLGLTSSTPPSNSGDRMFESLSEEIEGLLKQLNTVNEDMSEISSSTPGLATPALVHTLQRHRDILQDYSQEFRKTQNNLRSRREREELLHGVKKEIE